MTEYCEPTLESVLRIAAQDAVTWAHTLSILQDDERNEIDMTEQINPLPEFFPYKIPYGAIIPKGTRFVSPVETVTDTAYVNMVHQDTVHHSSYENGWTATPLDPPTPKKEDPPTEVGTLLTNVHTIQGHTCDYMILTSESSFPWKSTNLDGKQDGYRADHLVSWTRLDATSAEYNEDDHSDRLDSNGQRWSWFPESVRSVPNSHWSTSGPQGTTFLKDLKGVVFTPKDDPYDEGDSRDRRCADGLIWKWYEDSTFGEFADGAGRHWSHFNDRGTCDLIELGAELKFA